MREELMARHLQTFEDRVSLGKSSTQVGRRNLARPWVARGISHQPTYSKHIGALVKQLVEASEGGGKE